MKTSGSTATLLSLTLLLAACTGGGSERPAGPSSTGSPTKTSAAPHARFAGSTTCAECHAEIVESYRSSAHARASRPVGTRMPDFSNAG